jgi:ribosomal protein S18 acetylase RimI-like enzyme
VGEPAGIAIRPYQPADRAGVRHVCYATGYLGDRVDWLYRDQESFADLFSGYYTDAEPESAMVAERDGRVVGYLLGCVDSRRPWDPASIITRHIVRRGIAFRPGTAGFIWRSVVDSIRDRRHGPLPQAKIIDERWPAHLHVDLLTEARGSGVGSRLVHGWLDRLRSAGIAGCHLETFAENTTGIAFFKAMGFREEGAAILVPGFRSPAGHRHHVQLMVQPLAPDGRAAQ